MSRVKLYTRTRDVTGVVDRCTGAFVFDEALVLRLTVLVGRFVVFLEETDFLFAILSHPFPNGYRTFSFISIWFCRLEYRRETGKTVFIQQWIIISSGDRTAVLARHHAEHTVRDRAESRHQNKATIGIRR